LVKIVKYVIRLEVKDIIKHGRLERFVFVHYSQKVKFNSVYNK